ncbi:MAG: hypothetical protein JWO36_3433 [Myxococcales bacterium]|nr:hypothetical protein [Myxococcales bacterium]
MRGALVVVATVGLFGCSPYGGEAFVCQSSAQCSPNGVCEPTGFCSFPSADCPSGQRYGGLAGDHSNLCVGTPALGDDGGLSVGRDASHVDASPTSACYGSSTLVRECLAAPPTAALELGNMDIDTSSNSGQCATVVGGGNLDACVIAGSSIHVATDVVITAHGARPLVFLASSSIVIDGTIDIASHRNGSRVGPAANTVACATDGVSATSGIGGGGGGYGGSFAGAGGGGGSGAVGGDGGSPASTSTPAPLRGGCPGSNGASNGGARGDGGGAVHFIAQTSITITGTINASGGGGNGSSNLGGGGGGGSGGMIGFDAPTITITMNAKVFANGGGGGEGGGNGTGKAGNESTGGTANGGSGGAGNGGDGGNGAQGAQLTGGTGHDHKNGQAGGGGGGGGGGGVIRTIGTVSANGLISPTPS